MKNRKITYFVLLPLVFFVWGLIVYRILDGRNKDHTSVGAPSENTRKLDTVAENNVYRLLSHNDPFFSQQSYSSELNEDIEEDVALPKIQRKWPEIHLNGYIVYGTKIKCHLTINNEEKILQENEKVIEDFIISKITSDSIKVICKSDSRWYKK